ncbi:MAG: hypothetical protein HON90_17240, partial [Halobacteriovoraceae bacterium]|nr:hypothetical protein [Halobacteriovoraceae bacterium]
MKLGILIFLISMQAFADLQLWKKYKDKLFTPELIAQGSDCNVSLMDYDEIDNVNGQDCANTDGNHFSVAQPDRISDLSKHRRER